MIYIMSDIHGAYDKFMEMLEKINFSEEDELYILGDCNDRGPKVAEVYIEIMGRKNVHCLMGNHEHMMIGGLPYPFRYLRAGLPFVRYDDYDLWVANGGDETCVSFVSAGAETVAKIYDFVLSLPFYREVECGGKKYLLVHGGLCNYDPNRELSDYTVEELVWDRGDFDAKYYPDKYDKIIVGHTPTFLIRKDRPTSIYHGKGNVIDIDCGAIYSDYGGRLACLCLDTMEEFYV